MLEEDEKSLFLFIIFFFTFCFPAKIYISVENPYSPTSFFFFVVSLSWAHFEPLSYWEYQHLKFFKLVFRLAWGRANLPRMVAQRRMVEHDRLNSEEPVCIHSSQWILLILGIHCLWKLGTERIFIAREKSFLDGMREFFLRPQLRKWSAQKCRWFHSYLQWK